MLKTSNKDSRQMSGGQGIRGVGVGVGGGGMKTFQS